MAESDWRFMGGLLQRVIFRKRLSGRANNLPTSSLQALDVVDRGRRFGADTPIEIFKSYSRVDLFFEMGNAMKQMLLPLMTSVAVMSGCGGSSDETAKEQPSELGDQTISDEDSGSTDEDEEEEDEPREPIEIRPGLGIGPVELGGTYGALVEAYGEPDAMVDYYRIFFATWLELGVEVVVGSSRDDAPEPESKIVSVGTRLPDGFSGAVIPGMSRAEADEVLGPCVDVIDDTHCFHSAGVYLGYDTDGIIKTVAVHPPYTLRPEPPNLEPALGLGGVR